MIIEFATVTCPYCWQPVELEVDLSAGDQVYVEDCSVCCEPMVVKLTVSDAKPRGFAVSVEAENR